MENNETLEILRGNFLKLPEKEPSEIRIFLSSTFSDYTAERNYLIKNVYPDLRSFCQKFCRDLILIDMRWGITSEFEDEQLATQICLDEIQKCLTHSMGPYFVALMSHRYGTRLLKSNINKKEVELIKSNLNNDEKRLLEKFYEIDDNVVANCDDYKEYKLKNAKLIMLDIDHHLSFKVNKDNYKKKYEELKDAIDKVVKSFNSEIMSETQKNTFINSVTAIEVEHGILLSNEHTISLKTCVFFREIENYQNTQKNDKEKKYQKLFFETDPSVIDMLNILKAKVKQKLNENNYFTYNIDWREANYFEVVPPFISNFFYSAVIDYKKSIKEYLKKFGEDFKTNICELVKKNRTSSSNRIDPEILHHASVCNALNMNPANRPHHQMEKIHEYLNSENTKALVIGGPSGSGKTTLMANLLQKYYKERITIVRFMGTSRESSSIKAVFKSIIKQLYAINNLQSQSIIDNSNELFNDQNVQNKKSIIDLKYYLMERLKIIAKNGQKLLLLMDSIDQLAINDRKDLDWMLIDLPVNVKIIYSVLNDYEDIYEKIKEIVGTENCLEMKPIRFKDAKLIIEKSLASDNRKLTQKQWNLIDTVLKEVPQLYPLHVKLLFDISSKWRSSYQVPDEFKSCLSIKNTIKYQFRQMEKMFGEVLFTRCIFYLILFDYKGISENELEDIMSIDDDTLTSVFVYHHPPVRRFPIALWLNIKYQLKEYITSKETDGVPVIAWFHRAFIEASEEYLNTKRDIKESKDSILMNVIDYFNETWNEFKSNGQKGQIKEFIYEKAEKNKIRLSDFKQKPNAKITEYLAYRQTKPQKVRQENEDGSIKYNMRKLNELLNVITMIKDKKKKIELLKEHVYFNYEFMISKAELQEMNFVVDLHHLIIELGDEELIECSKLYVAHYPALESSPSTVCWIIPAKLGGTSHYVRKLAEPSHLIVLHKIIIDSFVNHLFVVRKDNQDTIVDYFQICNRPYLFIRTKREKGNDCLHLVNSKTAKILGELDLKMKNVDNIQITLSNEEIGDVKTIHDLNGLVYFTYGRKLYSKSFNDDDEFSNVITFSTNIKFLVLMKSLLIILDKSIYKLNSEGTPIMLLEKDDEIVEFKSTLMENEVYLISDLNRFDGIAIICALKNKTINIYHQFNQEIVKICEIKNIQWNLYGFGEWNGRERTWRETIIIDESYLKNYDGTIINDETILRFAIEGDNVVKVIDINRQHEYSIVDQIDKTRLNIKTQECNDTKSYQKLELIGLFKNEILLSLRIDKNLLVNIYAYNLGTRMYQQIEQIKGNRLYYLRQINSIASIYIDYPLCNLTLYKLNVNEFEIEKWRYINVSLNQNLKRSIKVSDNKLLGITGGRRASIYMDYSRDDERNPLKFNEILHQLNNIHILANIQNETNEEYVIIDVVTKNIIDTIPNMNKKRYLGCNKNYLVFIGSNQECNRNLFIYKIIEDHVEKQKLRFIQRFKEKITFQINIKKSGCYFSDKKKTELIVKLYHDDMENNKFEILFLQDDENKLKCQNSVIFDLNNANIRLDREKMKSTITTSLSNHLILFESKGGDVIYYIYLPNQKIVAKVKLNRTCVDQVLNLPNTNDLIVKYTDGSLNIFYFNENNNRIEEKSILNDEFVIKVKIDVDYLICVTKSKRTFLYKLVDFKMSNNQPTIPITFDKEAWDTCVSINSKYFILYTPYPLSELLVYKLNQKEGIRQIHSSIFHSWINYLHSSEKYLSGIYDPNSSQLLTFEIIDEGSDNPMILTDRFVRLKFYLKNLVNYGKKYFNATCFFLFASYTIIKLHDKLNR